MQTGGNLYITLLFLCMMCAGGNVEIS